jgi:acylglycerol lipase
VHAGYAIYGIDQEGHGKSSGLKGYIASFGDIVKDRADYFKSVCGKN